MDYQKKYNELKAISNKQQSIIAGLRNQIRERCQSYLLQASRTKKLNDSVIKADENEQRSQAKLAKSYIEESKVQPVVSYSRVQLYNISNSNILEPSLYQSYVSEKSKKLNIISQININQLLINHQKIAQTQSILLDSIRFAQSYQQRIAKLQSEKVQYVKQVQALQKKLHQQAHHKHQLSTQLQKVIKAQKKLKDKLRKLPDWQVKIQQIYQKLNQHSQQSNDILDKNDEQEMSIDQKYDLIMKNIQKISKDDSKREPQQRKRSPEKQFKTENKKKDVQPSEQTIIKQLNTAQIKKYAQQIVQVTDFSQKSQLKTSKKQDQRAQLSQTKNQSIERVLKQKESQIQKLIKQKQQLKDLRIEHEFTRNQNFLLEKQISQLKTKIQQFQRHKQTPKPTQHSNKKQQARINSTQPKVEYSKPDYEKCLSQLSKLKVKMNEHDRSTQQYKRIILSRERQTIQLKEQLNKRQLELYEKTKVISEKNTQISQYKSLVQVLKLTKIQSQNKLRTQIKEELDQTKISSQINRLKKQLNQSKKSIQRLNSSRYENMQKLQAPYFVEEDIETNYNNEFVKRSFIRKKIIRRNLSASTYRVVSKSKQQLQSILNKKINEYKDKSLEKRQRNKNKQISLKEMLKNSLKQQRISEVSEQRESDSKNNYEQQQIKVFQIVTKTPTDQTKTLKIYADSPNNRFNKKH